MSALENKVRMLQMELEKKTSVKMSASASVVGSASTTTTPIYCNNNINGYSHSPIRPESRGSTIYSHRSMTPTRRVASFAAGSMPCQPSVRDSIHAPHGPVKYPSLSTMHAPTGRYPSIRRGKTRVSSVRQPSPTGSVVSNAPTLGEDGWWE